MLTISIPDREFYNEKENRVILSKGRTIQLEHSLISISRWESKWEKPYLSNKEKTYDEALSYIQCMTVTPNVDPVLYFQLGKKEFEMIDHYIHRKMTATTVNHRKKGGRSQIITSEVIYYQMILYGVPFECEKWHLNRLLMLLDVCSAKGGTQEKMPLREQLDEQRRLNEQRMKQFKTRG